MQNFERVNAGIRERFLEHKRSHPEKMESRLKLSWSNWGFGMEPLEQSVERLARFGIEYIELHGNHYGEDLGYAVEEVRAALSGHGVKAAGVCGMFSRTNDLSSNEPTFRQNAVSYLKRTIPFTRAVGGSYLLVVPGAVGRSAPYDGFEIFRSAETLRLVADLFVQHQVRAAVEPIRSAEVSLVHTFQDARRYIELVDHPGVRHINGDVYHMLAEERHIAATILEAGEQLVNLHLADTNRGALGEGSLDVDTIMMALYLVGFNDGERFCTPEPLGPGGDPYPAMYGRPEKTALDRLVETTVRTWREREEHIRSL